MKKILAGSVCWCDLLIYSWLKFMLCYVAKQRIILVACLLWLLPFSHTIICIHPFLRQEVGIGRNLVSFRYPLYKKIIQNWVGQESLDYCMHWLDISVTQEKLREMIPISPTNKQYMTDYLAAHALIQTYMDGSIAIAHEQKNRPTPIGYQDFEEPHFINYSYIYI